MKRLTKTLNLFIFLFLASWSSGFSQTLKEFFNSKETKALYIGIDFTKAKVLGDNTANAADIHERQYAGINDVVVNEPKKYEIAEAFDKTKIDNDISLVIDRNKNVKTEDIISTNSSDYNRLKESDITTLVKGFDFKGKTGMGILFVVEALSKTEKAAAVWVTLVDMSAKKVLLTERIEGKAAGFGFRNYWAGAFREVLKTIEKKKYDEWKSKYGS
jgi:hypothetical protein